MNQPHHTLGSVRPHLIRGFALALAAGTLLTGCAQKGPASTSETVAGSSYGGGSTTDPGTSDPGTGGTDPSGGATTSPSGSASAHLLKLDVNGQDYYEKITQYNCYEHDGELHAYGTDAELDPTNASANFTMQFTVGAETDVELMIQADDFYGTDPAEGTSFAVTFDQSTETYSVSGKMDGLLSSDPVPFELSGTCK